MCVPFFFSAGIKFLQVIRSPLWDQSLQPSSAEPACKVSQPAQYLPFARGPSLNDPADSPLFHSRPSAPKSVTKPHGVKVGEVTLTQKRSRAGIGLLPHSAGVWVLWRADVGGLQASGRTRWTGSCGTRVLSHEQWSRSKFPPSAEVEHISVFCMQPDLCWRATDFCSQLLTTPGIGKANPKNHVWGKPLFVKKTVSH